MANDSHSRPVLKRSPSDNTLSPSATKVDEHVEKKLKTEAKGLNTIQYAVEGELNPSSKNAANAQDAKKLLSPDEKERGATQTANKSPEPEPSGDTRIPHWQDETRDFAGELIIVRKKLAISLAQEAQMAELMVDDGIGGSGTKPQYNLFVDGSYEQDNVNKHKPQQQRWGRGGYGVVFRNPYNGKGGKKGVLGDSLAEFNHNNDPQTRYVSRPAQRRGGDGGLSPEDFNIRSWRTHHSLSALQTELAAIAQGMDTVARVHGSIGRHHHQPFSSSVTIFTDSKSSINRIARGARPDATSDRQGYGEHNKNKNKNGETQKEEEEITTSSALTTPLIRTIIWLSHFLADLGCEIKLQWMPRCTVLAHKLADEVAGWWKKEGEEALIFNERDRPPWRRDGILDALHHDGLLPVVERLDAAEELLRLDPPFTDLSEMSREEKRLKNWDHKAVRQQRKERRQRQVRDGSNRLLENFSGSAVQSRMSTEALLEMPPLWNRSAAFSMVNEDMAKVLKDTQSKKRG